MKVGTKSVLFGAHCFFIHPWFVAYAWYKLWGFKEVTDEYVTTSLKDWRLWLAFFVHDLGYWGKPNMDGKEGESHPIWGAEVMDRFFGRYFPLYGGFVHDKEKWKAGLIYVQLHSEWGFFVLMHSRFYAKKYKRQFSALCVADKLATTLVPWWLYIPMATATGEINEYRELAGATNEDSKYAGEPKVETKYSSMNLRGGSARQWFEGMTSYMRAWAYEHQDLKVDTWTPE